jgi:hypothetical protein
MPSLRCEALAVRKGPAEQKKLTAGGKKKLASGMATRHTSG